MTVRVLLIPQPMQRSARLLPKRFRTQPKFIIAQRISSVQNADRIIVLDNGVVNGFGTHEELLESNDIYRDVYESQTSGSGDFDEGGAA